MGLDSWRPNIHIFRPQDYWKGSVDYVPWKLGDGDDCNPKVLCKGTKPSEGVELEVGSGMTRCGRKKGEEASASAAPGIASSKVALARAYPVEGGRIGGAGVAGEVELEELGANAKQSGAVVMMGGKDKNSTKSASDRSTTLKPGEVETVLHSMLDALRKVRAERLRLLTTRFTRTPETAG